MKYHVRKIVPRIALLLCLASGAQAAIDTGLIAHYPFEGNANEATGRYVHGTLQGNASFAAGVVGQALRLDGDGDYVDIGNGLNLFDFYSVSAWIKPEDLTREWPAILAKYETNGAGPYDFDLHFSKANAWISDGSGGNSLADSNAPIQAGVWTHVAFVGAMTTLKIYINGQLDQTATVARMTQNGDRVTIGRQALMFPPFSDLEWKGYIDDLRVYDRALADAEVQELFGLAGTVTNATVVEFFNAGLNHYFRTASAPEAQAVDAGGAGPGWVRTGNDFVAYASTGAPAGTSAVCRFYGSINPGPNSHFYTGDPAECAALKALQAATPASEPRWNYEEIAFNIDLPAGGQCAGGRVAVLRAYNNRAAQGDSNHRYTTSASYYQQMLAQGWLGEDTVMCALGATGGVTGGLKDEARR